MGEIIDGKKYAALLREDCKKRADALKEKGIFPKLDVIIVGDDPASRQYVASRAKDCDAVGIKSEVHALPAETDEKALTDLLEKLSGDNTVHGILLQMPLPKNMDAKAVVSHILPLKDVDGLNINNIGMLLSGGKDFIPPCTPSSILHLIKSVGVPIAGKNAVVIGRSNVVGRPAAMLLLRENATVTICHSKTRELAAHTGNADILVAAVGVPRLVKGNMIKKGAIVIDAGINRVDGKTVGDVDFEAAKEAAGFITPVPGGVGPVTRAMLLQNTLAAAEKQSEIK